MILGLFADTHINIFRKSNSFLKYVEDAFDFFGTQCRLYNVERIIGLGDVFHTKSYIATDALITANKFIYNLTSIAPVILLSGNHDMISYNNAELNLLDNYNYFPKLRIINKNFETFEIKGGCLYFVPYASERSILETLNTINHMISVSSPTEKHYLFGHFGVTGFTYMETEYGSIQNNETILPPENLSKFDKVLLGHFHGYQYKGNVIYVSAPLQSKFTDEYSKHGIIIFDTETGEHKFIENSNTPKFVSLELTKDNVKNIIKQENQIIRLIVKKHVSKELLDIVKIKLLEKNIDVEWRFEIPTQAMTIASMQGFEHMQYTTTDELLAGYVNHLNNQKLVDYNIEDLLGFILK